MAGEITTLAEYVRRIEIRKESSKFTPFYRGHDTSGHDLQPSLFRTKSNRQHEKNILRELLSIQPSEFASDRGVFENLVRMQHYSLPTRLLDISTNPLVALYFACATKQNSDGEVIQINAPSRIVKYFDSDAVSCVANLANLRGNERDELRRTHSSPDLKESDAGKRLLQFIRSEKPYFLPEIDRNDINGPFIVKPRLTNRRLLAQQGAFVIFGLKVTISDVNDEFSVTRTLVSAKSKKKIISSLDRLGINRSTMFPEIDNTAQYIMDKVTPPPSDELTDEELIG